MGGGEFVLLSLRGREGALGGLVFGVGGFQLSMQLIDFASTLFGGGELFLEVFLSSLEFFAVGGVLLGLAL
jgi:hypothetical protein